MVTIHCCLLIALAKSSSSPRVLNLVVLQFMSFPLLHLVQFSQPPLATLCTSSTTILLLAINGLKLPVSLITYSIFMDVQSLYNSKNFHQLILFASYCSTPTKKLFLYLSLAAIGRTCQALTALCLEAESVSDPGIKMAYLLAIQWMSHSNTMLSENISSEILSTRAIWESCEGNELETEYSQSPLHCTPYSTILFPEISKPTTPHLQIDLFRKAGAFISPLSYAKAIEDDFKVSRRLDALAKIDKECRESWRTLVELVSQFGPLLALREALKSSKILAKLVHLCEMMGVDSGGLDPEETGGRDESQHNAEITTNSNPYTTPENLDEFSEDSYSLNFPLESGGGSAFASPEYISLTAEILTAMSQLHTLAAALFALGNPGAFHLALDACRQIDSMRINHPLNVIGVTQFESLTLAIIAALCATNKVSVDDLNDLLYFLVAPLCDRTEVAQGEKIGGNNLHAERTKSLQQNVISSKLAGTYVHGQHENGPCCRSYGGDNSECFDDTESIQSARSDRSTANDPKFNATASRTKIESNCFPSLVDPGEHGYALSHYWFKIGTAPPLCSYFSMSPSLAVLLPSASLRRSQYFSACGNIYWLHFLHCSNPLILAHKVIISSHSTSHLIEAARKFILSAASHPLDDPNLYKKYDPVLWCLLLCGGIDMEVIWVFLAIRSHFVRRSWFTLCDPPPVEECHPKWPCYANGAVVLDSLISFCLGTYGHRSHQNKKPYGLERFDAVSEHLVRLRVLTAFPSDIAASGSIGVKGPPELSGEEKLQELNEWYESRVELSDAQSESARHEVGEKKVKFSAKNGKVGSPATGVANNHSFERANTNSPHNAHSPLHVLPTIIHNGDIVLVADDYYPECTEFTRDGCSIVPVVCGTNIENHSYGHCNLILQHQLVQLWLEAHTETHGLLPPALLKCVESFMG